jgi:hypothetical protein
MPYKVEKDGEDYLVINEETGEEKARHTPPDAEEKAHKQVRLLEDMENNPDFKPTGE